MLWFCAHVTIYLALIPRALPSSHFDCRSVCSHMVQLFIFQVCASQLLLAAASGGKWALLHAMPNEEGMLRMKQLFADNGAGQLHPDVFRVILKGCSIDEADVNQMLGLVEVGPAGNIDVSQFLESLYRTSPGDRDLSQARPASNSVFGADWGRQAATNPRC